MISQGVLRALEDGPLTIDELSARMCVPRPHVRAAVAELVFRDRQLTCIDGHRFAEGAPPSSWPPMPRFV